MHIINKKQKMIFVLGMHRSGTSAITRGLQVLNVQLGNQFIPPAEDNKRGFWEDKDINAFNIEVMGALNTDWHLLSPINTTDIELLRLQGYHLRATELIKKKINGYLIYGFKDPRITKLLPFWIDVLKYCQYDVSFILTIRNPLSVTKSLTKRNNFYAEKNYQLWLEHVLSSLSGSIGKRRVLVDYDYLMQSPEKELIRIANSLELEIDSTELEKYKSEFLDEALRHTTYSTQDLFLDDACPPLAQEIYTHLLNVASDEISLDSQELQHQIDEWVQQLERNKSLLILTDKYSNQISNLNQSVAEHNAQVVSLNQAVAERDAQVVSLNQAVVERDAQVVSLNQAVVERDAQVVSLNQAVVERDAQVVSLNQAVVERDAQVTKLKAASNLIAEQHTSLTQSIHDKENHIANLHSIVEEYSKIIREITTSHSWRITKPMRLGKSIFTKKPTFEGLPQHNLQQFNTEWYLQVNPDVAASGIDAYQHYIVHGQNEGRAPIPDPLFLRNKKRLQVIQKTIPLALRRGGGLKNTLHKAWKIMKREGLPGIRRRVVYLYAQTQPTQGHTIDRNNYAEWLKKYDCITNETRQLMQKQVAMLTYKPLISVVMPTYNPKSEWLIEAIESVRNQIYPHWELCIADDASTDTTIHPILKRYTKEDARIKVIFREKNGHISAASNSALELASGEWVALLDHDDCLTEHALFWVVTELNQNPETQLIYSDEDKIDEKNQRFDPYFKCDWNYELCLSQNQITHLGVYRRDLLKQLEGFRLGMEGAQDYDLVLRYIELIDHNQIHHIPRVLYHWRVHTDSTALGGGDAKPYAMLAGQKALDEHFQRTGTDASAELIGHGYKINYKLPNSLPKVSIIIPTRNGFKLTKQCIDSIIKKTTYNNYEIIIIDNGSNDYKILEYFKSLSLHNNIHVIRDDSPFNYSALNNLAVKQAEGDFICLLNNDIEVISPDWLSEMVGIAIQPNTGAVGARLWYPDNTLQHGGIILGIGGWAGHAHKGFNKGHPGYVGRMSLMSNFSAVTGACLLVRKSLFEKLGGLNENDLKIACNDVDFCLRLKKAGYRNVWTPFADLYHHESATRGYEDTPEKKARFAKELEYMQQHWNQELCHDPAYNPNLTLNHEDFSLAWPPRIDIFSDKTPDQSNQISKSIDKTKHLNRIDKALFAIDKYGTGLEIGPSHNPIAPKKQGFNVHILDHASADELKQKYQGHGLNLDNIEEVDFVWHGEHLQELIGKSECYDWIIASHVIEHVPDLISFLQQCETLLKPTGILSLIIPDKRYCFDYFNSLTSTGMLLDAWAGKHKRPSSGKVFDHYSNAAKQNGNIAWGSDSVGADALVHSVIEAKTHWERAQASTDYIDVHCWRFTPTSFSLLLSDLQMLGLINLEIKTGFDTTGCEFYVSLGKGKSTCNENRFLSLENIRKENAHTYTFGH